MGLLWGPFKRILRGIDMYNATLYRGTKFNTINTPASKSVLDAVVDTVSVPALDIYQARQLSSFVVRATREQLENVDYLYLANDSDVTDFAYYTVSGFAMTSKDTAVLSVNLDPGMTAGGLINMDFLDGIVERHHVPKDADKFGAFDEHDPYISPAQPLLVDLFEPDFTGPQGETNPHIRDEVTILETTVNLYKMYTQGQSALAKLKAIDWESQDNNVVTVPTVEAGQEKSYLSMHWGSASSQKYRSSALPNATFYAPDWHTFWSDQLPDPSYDYDSSDWLSEAITYIRSLGLEDAIIAQYSIPYYMIMPTEISPLSGNKGPNPSDRPEQKMVGVISELSGNCVNDEVDLPFERNYTHVVQNNRLFYGENCQYHIVSIASGNEAQFLPEEIRYNNQNKPFIRMVVDPRPKGAPYFRFTYFRGDGDGSSVDINNMFFRNAVRGLGWQNVPLRYEGGSASLLNQYKYESQVEMGLFNASNTIFQKSVESQRMGIGSLLNALGSLGSAASNMAGSANAIGDSIRFSSEGSLGMQYGIAPTIGANISSPIGSLVNAAYSIFNGGANNIQNYVDIQKEAPAWNLERNTELANLLIANQVVAPSIQFPISEGIRDFIGNTCLVYRTYYTEADVTRLDKILNMYGYRHTVPMDKSLLTNRSKFNYIKAAGVSVSNSNIPKWLRDAVGAQLSAGIRIWHVLPDENAYTDGTNI